MLKIVKVARFSDSCTSFSDIIFFLQPKSIIPLKMAISKKKSRLTYESISKI